MPEKDSEADAGVARRFLFQPEDRFRTFQATEAAIYLSPVAVLIGLTVWLVRRRMS